jgi:hypothetical protein
MALLQARLPDVATEATEHLAICHPCMGRTLRTGQTSKIRSVACNLRRPNAKIGRDGLAGVEKCWRHGGTS